MPENKILVVRGGAIGDFVLTLPVLSALRRQFPSSQLELLGYPRVAELARWGGLADNVRSLEDRPVAHFFARGAALAADWQEFFGRFAIIISYLFDPDLIFQENVRRCSTAQFLSGPHRPNDLSPLHATRVLLAPLEQLAIFEADPIPRLAPPNSSGGSNIVSKKNGHAAQLKQSHDTEAVSEWVGKGLTTAVHPGSGSQNKNWPEREWRSLLLKLLAETPDRFLLVGGEAEGDRLERLSEGLPEERVRLARNRPLPQLAGILAQCTRFIGHDSGISHLAAAVGVTTTVLWGPTSEVVWRPLGTHVQILKHHEGLSRLSVSEVLEAILKSRSPAQTD